MSTAIVMQWGNICDFYWLKKIIGTSDNTGLLPMFTIERNAKFHLEVCKN